MRPPSVVRAQLCPAHSVSVVGPGLCVHVHHAPGWLNGCRSATFGVTCAVLCMPPVASRRHHGQRRQLSYRHCHRCCHHVPTRRLALFPGAHGQPRERLQHAWHRASVRQHRHCCSPLRQKPADPQRSEESQVHTGCGHGQNSIQRHKHALRRPMHRRGTEQLLQRHHGTAR